MKNNGTGEIARFESYLARNGQRLTRGRRIVLSHVLGMEGHFDAEQLVGRIRDTKQKVSRATVYRTLEQIEERNLVKRVDIGAGRRIFERVSTMNRHEHMHCIRCGKTVEFSDPVIRRRVKAISMQRRFSPATQALEILGMCNECAEALRLSENTEPPAKEEAYAAR